MKSNLYNKLKLHRLQNRMQLNQMKNLDKRTKYNSDWPRQANRNLIIQHLNWMMNQIFSIKYQFVQWNLEHQSIHRLQMWLNKIKKLKILTLILMMETVMKLKIWPILVFKKILLTQTEKIYRIKIENREL